MNKNTSTKLHHSFRQLICLIILMAGFTAYSQSDSLDKKKGLPGKIYNQLFNSEETGSKYFFYPSIAYTPETSFEIGISALRLFYSKSDSSNRLSEVQSFGFFTLNKQYGGFLEHFIYTDKDKWFFLGKLKAQRFPLQYYGIGMGAQKADELLIGADYIAAKERVLHCITDNFFGGIELDYQRVSRTRIQHPGENQLVIPGIEGSSSLGLGLGLVYDNRHNALNVRNGLFAELAYLHYGKSGGGSFDFASTNLDLRYFKSVSKNQVLAAQLYGQFVNGAAPFNMMALLGSESIMRGYYYGRFRDNHYLAAQAEYRFLPFGFSKRIGGAAFLSVGSVQPELRQFSFKDILPAGGVGLRYLIFPKKDIFIRLDVGFTQEGQAFYIYTGEAF